MARPQEQTARPDAEDKDVEHLIGEECDDPFPDTWPDPEDNL